MHELLTPDEMAAVDRRAIEDGPFDGYRLMLNAGASVTAAILERFAGAEGFDVLCGPGNNGGDGYVVARLLAERGLQVRVWREAPPRENYAAAIGRVSEAKARVVAVDLPSGVSGASGRALGSAFNADLTVTFFRRKPGHLLYPGRGHCGEVLVADIGIGESALAAATTPRCFENGPALWREALPVPEADAHKYRRGHAAVFSGGPGATGAARLAAEGAARAGAGAVTLLSPGPAMLVNAAHLTAIMLARVDTSEELAAFAETRGPTACVLGPGFGADRPARDFALACLGGTANGLVLDADGITAFAEGPEMLFRAAHGAGASLVLTPHAGEFARLFPDLAGDEALSKLDAARAAARRAGAVVLYKGPDTVIAAPDGRAVISANGTPWLATAGSGDVLAGMIGGLLAQKMPAFEAACAAAWLHAEAGRAFGPGLTADDLPDLLPGVVGRLLAG